MQRVLATAFCCLAGPLAAAEVTDFTLDNGMEVVVLEDHRAPAVVHMVWYKVGSADEPRGKSGIAHFLEHLMFKGTDEVAAGELSRVVAENGGTDNAFTSQDYTGYFQRVAADRLALMMEMEADRMTDLQITEDVVIPERDVVLEERNQRTENDPGSIFGEERSAAQYLNHPYGTPVVGWQHEIAGLTRNDALAFYKEHYAPNNAILIVAGDVEPAEVRRLAEETYGEIPANPAVGERERAEEPPQRAERRIVYEDPRVAQPYLVRTYLAPERDAGDQRKAAALTLLAELLGGSSATSVLGEKLQFDSDVALHSSAFYRGVSLDDTTFGLAVVPSAGVSLEEAEGALDDALAEFLQEGIDPERFERIKMQIRASEIYEEDDVAALGRRYGAALASGLTVEDVEAWPALLGEITEEEVLAAAREVFDRRRAVTGWMRAPEGAALTPAAAKIPAGVMNPTGQEEVSQ